MDHEELDAAHQSSKIGDDVVFHAHGDAEAPKPHRRRAGEEAFVRYIGTMPPYSRPDHVHLPLPREDLSGLKERLRKPVGVTWRTKEFVQWLHLEAHAEDSEEEPIFSVVLGEEPLSEDLLAEVTELLPAEFPLGACPPRPTDRVRPPSAAQYALCFIVPRESREAVLGDLEEHFTAMTELFGEKRAGRWYWWEVFRSLWPLIKAGAVSLVTLGILGFVERLIRRPGG